MKISLIILHSISADQGGSLVGSFYRKKKRGGDSKGSSSHHSNEDNLF